MHGATIKIISTHVSLISQLISRHVQQKFPLAAFIHNKGQCPLRHFVINYVIWLLQNIYTTANPGYVKSFKGFV